MNKRQKLALIVLTSLSLVSGCGLQRVDRGSEAASDQLAAVRIHGAFFRRVNGVEISKWSSGVLIPPGKNEFEFVIDPTYFNAGDVASTIYRLTIDAQPASEYLISGPRGLARLCAWPIKSDTGKPDLEHPAGCAYRD